MKHIFAVCGMALALICGAGAASAQDNNGGGGGGFRRGGGNFNPEEMRAHYMDFIRNYIGFTNDADWSAVQPLVQKVLDAQRDMGSAMGNGFRMFIEQQRGDRGGDQNGSNRRSRGGGMFGAQPGPEYTALQDAINNNAPAAQVKELLTRYNAAQKAKQDKLKSAQDGLRAVLEPGTQEAKATLLGLIN
ncbi:MAG TPA: hypothetical protein VH280_08575 [Verrucomicrobiae bacterium]|nr:hypothetical protein [Verrucomicrobiae bacterium]